jgi:hypothetical protein
MIRSKVTSVASPQNLTRTVRLVTNLSTKSVQFYFLMTLNFVTEANARKTRELITNEVKESGDGLSIKLGVFICGLINGSVSM